MSLWSARFQKESDLRLQEFNSSIRIDRRMYQEDIEGSIAHADMLCKQGIISEKDYSGIKSGLTRIREELETGVLTIDENAEDIHMFIEAKLTERIGDAGKRLHTGRSRNDQVALDFRMYSMNRTDEIVDLLEEMIRTLVKKAKENINTIMPGYTHLQRAQPITFAHHLLAYAQMYLRDIERLKEAKRRTASLPLGCGALATSTFLLDREYVRAKLGFESICMNSLDGVSDRDFAVELAADMSLIMVHLSRFSEEMVLWCSYEFKFVEPDDAFATGSSIMPQKKNPDIPELVRGKSGRVFGNLQTLLVMLKGLSLAYNKDLQEDKEALFDSFDTVKACLLTTIPMIDTMTVLKENMRLAAAKGFINATDCADYLTKKGMPFRDAYVAVGKLVAYAQEAGKTLEELTLPEYRTFCDRFEADVFQAISLEKCVQDRNVVGGPAPNRVKEQIEWVQKKLENV